MLFFADNIEMFFVEDVNKIVSNKLPGYQESELRYLTFLYTCPLTTLFGKRSSFSTVGCQISSSIRNPNGIHKPVYHFPSFATTPRCGSGRKIAKRRGFVNSKLTDYSPGGITRSRDETPHRLGNYCSQVSRIRSLPKAGFKEASFSFGLSL